MKTGRAALATQGDFPVTTDLSRRDWLSALGAGLTGTALASSAPAKETPREPFRYSLNTSTLRGQKLKLTEEIDLAARAGYQAIEPWLGEIKQYVESGGSLKDLKKRIHDHGLEVPSAIGFAQWIVDDETHRKKGLEEAKRDMGWLAEIGGQRIAAPPTGATRSSVDLFRAAERYRVLLELGDRMGIVPEAEVWGFSKTMSRLGETVLVAVESRHPKACILPDIYHLYKGGSGFAGLHLLGGAGMHVLHVNDYPAAPPRAEITDAHRVYPGDGVAPLRQILQTLRDVGFHGYLSLELFNRDYWMQDPMKVARIGLEKIKTAVKNSL
jgi:2-keto-myo-inositol isomerase